MKNLLRNIVVVVVLALASPIVSADGKNLRSKAGKGGGKSHVHKVRKGDSIQDAIDDAEPGDIIKVWPGVYTEQASLYGLRISTNNIKLMAKGGPGSVRLVASGAQETGVYAAPEGCEYKDNDCDEILEDFSIEGFSVEGFPVNGIQTRWVDGFNVENCYSVSNLNNGIYPTLSSNGRIAGSTASGSLDAGLWIAGSADITALDNEIYESTTGFEVTVSRNLHVSNNKIHDNTVGIGLYHPNMAGTKPDWMTYENWTFEGNRVYENNLPNPAPPDTFQYGLESGVGALLIGVSSHTIEGNVFDGNDWAGVRQRFMFHLLYLVFSVVLDSSTSLFTFSFLHHDVTDHCCRILYCGTIGLR